MTSSEQVKLWMGRENPESIMFASEGLDSSALSHVPHTDGLVFADRQNEFLTRMEKRAGNVVKVAAHSIDLPGFRIAHSPELDLSIETGGEEPTAVVGEGDVFDEAGVAHEGAEAGAGAVDVPELREE